jgi:hypothetical protein
MKANLNIQLVLPDAVVRRNVDGSDKLSALRVPNNDLVLKSKSKWVIVSQVKNAASLMLFSLKDFSLKK